jgi:HPt (histidine-containing phosphotransfer) domain-containing protein
MTPDAMAAASAEPTSLETTSLETTSLEPTVIEERRTALARLRRFGGERLMRDMAAVFVGVLRERVDAARAAVAAGDGEALAKAAHSLRSSCGQFGASSAARLCADVELRAAEGVPPHALAPAVDEMVRACDEYGAWLAHELDMRGDPEVSR